MTTRRAQLQEDTNFRVLRMLQANPDLTQREIERDNPEFRLVEDIIQFLTHIYSRDITEDDQVTIVHFSEVIEYPPLD